MIYCANRDKICFKYLFLLLKILQGRSELLAYQENTVSDFQIRNKGQRTSAKDFLTHKDVKVLSLRTKRGKTANQGRNRTGTFASYFQPVLSEESRFSSPSNLSYLVTLHSGLRELSYLVVMFSTCEAEICYFSTEISYSHSKSFTLEQISNEICINMQLESFNCGSEQKC